MEKTKILVLMSGGVDSSTAAALLKEAGHAVAGLYLKLWQTADSQLSTALGDECWAKEMADAARVAAHLNIPFQVWDVTADYKKRVLENFYAEYAAGRTPNPDVLCNSEIKFGIGLARALETGYEYVASGHYAQLREVTLRVALDQNKDQSYFLWRLTPEQLNHIKFPIGGYTKPQVRELARKFGLHNADKKDSQGVCFLGKIKLKEFLKPAVAEQAGPILDVHGTLLGYHDGLAHFTIGQRHGTRLGGTGPYFVVEKDLAINVLFVARESEEPEYRTAECRMQNAECRMPREFRCLARVRYRGELLPVAVHDDQVTFDKPARAVAPGQSIVFYDGDRVIGGGHIDRTVLKTPIEICPVQKYAHVS